MGARDGRQLGAERLLEYRAQAMPAEVGKAEESVLAQQRVDGQFPRIAVRASTSRATGPDRQSRLASWHIDHLCPVLPRDCDMPRRLGIDEICGGVRFLGTAHEIVPFTPFAQMPPCILDFPGVHGNHS